MPSVTTNDAGRTGANALIGSIGVKCSPHKQAVNQSPPRRCQSSKTYSRTRTFSWIRLSESLDKQMRMVQIEAAKRNLSTGDTMKAKVRISAELDKPLLRISAMYMCISQSNSEAINLDRRNLAT